MEVSFGHETVCYVILWNSLYILLQKFLAAAELLNYCFKYYANANTSINKEY